MSEGHRSREGHELAELCVSRERCYGDDGSLSWVTEEKTWNTKLITPTMPHDSNYTTDFT